MLSASRRDRIGGLFFATGALVVLPPSLVAQLCREYVDHLRGGAKIDQPSSVHAPQTKYLRTGSASTGRSLPSTLLGQYRNRYNHMRYLGTEFLFVRCISVPFCQVRSPYRAQWDFEIVKKE